MKFKFLFFIQFAFCLSVAAAHGAIQPDYGKIPLSFEANLGQTDEPVKFLSRGPGYGLFLTSREAVLRLTHPAFAEVRMRLAGQSGSARIEGIDPLPGKTHYLKGSSSSEWHGGVPSYARVRYAGVYPGVDVIYYGNQRQLEYDIVIAPGARPGVVKIQFENIQGLAIDKGGRLVLKTAAGEIHQSKPSIYQEAGGKRVSIEGDYILLGKRAVGFRVASYDPTQPLIIDPVLVYSSYFGGTGTEDHGNAIAVDAAGNAYITGQTNSTNLLVIGGVQATLGGALDGFVLKLNPAGDTVLYSTYFGGSANDEGHSIAIDAGGNAYVAGYTASSDFPVVNGFQRGRAGGQDAYLLKLNSTGSALVFSTYLGGSADDRALGVAVDAAGNACLTGTTSSNNFPTASPLQQTNGGGMNDVFVTKVSPGGNLIYSTYVGGVGIDQAYSVAMDGAGSAYVVGYTSSPNFPMANALQGLLGGGSDDAFALKLSATGSTLEYSTYIGGVDSDNAVRVAVDGTGSAYLTGYTASPDFPTLNPYSEVPFGDFDAFVTRLAPDGKSLIYSTFLGGSGIDSGTGIAFDALGNVYVSGYTTSFDFPVVNSIKDFPTGDRDAYVVKFTPDGKTIVYATYLGGSGIDAAVGLAVDAAGNAYLTGLTRSADFEVVFPFQPASGGGQDAFIAKINASDVLSSLQFQTAPQAGASFQTGGTRGDLIFGYSTAEPATPGTRLTGLAILDFQRTGQGGTEVALLAPPLLNIGRMSVEVSAVVRSVISIVNPNDGEASVDFHFTDQSGAPSNFATETIPARGHFSRFVTDEPFLITEGSVGTLTFNSSVPIAVSGFRAFTNESSQFVLSPTPIADVLSVTQQPAVIPEFAEGAGWNSQVVLVNTTENEMNGEVHFISQGGTPIEVGIDDGSSPSVVEYGIPARSSRRVVTSGTATQSDFPFSARGAFSFITPGVNLNQSSGYAVAESTPANTSAHGLQILEYRSLPSTEEGAPQERITTSQTAVLAPPLLLAGRLFVDVASQVKTQLSIANPADQDATVELYVDDSGGSSAPIAVTVPARGQVYGFLEEETFSVQLASAGTLSFSSSIPVAVTALRFFTNENNNPVISALPIADLSRVANQPAVIPYFADGEGWKTQIVFVNTTDQVMNGEMRFFSQGSASEPGSPTEVGIGEGAFSASVLEYFIQPRSFQRIDTAGIAETLKTGSIRVVPFAGFNAPNAYAMLVLRSSGTTITQTAVEAQAPARSFRLYAEAFGNYGAAAAGATNTLIALANPSSAPATARFDLTRLDGASLSSASIQIPANGQIAMFLNQLPGFQTLSAPLQGMLQVTVTSGSGIAAVGIRAMINQRGNFLAAATMPFNDETNSPRLVFPYITDGNGYTSKFIILNNAAGQNVSSILRFVAQDGTPLPLDTVKVGSVRVVPFQGSDTPHAHVILSHKEFATTKFQTHVEARPPATNLRFYADAIGDFDTGEPRSARTGIALANPFTTPVTVRLDLTAFDGRSLGSSSIQIPARGEVTMFLNQFPGFESLPATFQAVLRASVTAGSGITAAGLRATFNDTGSLLMTTTGPLYEDAGRPGLLVFPHVAEGGGYTTRFIVVNSSSAQSTGMLHFFNETGAPIYLTLSGR